MDNLTHSLVGLAAARAGLERVSPYATPLCLVAANLPDADVVTLAFGPWTYLHQHRGLSHSVVGVLALGVALPLVFWAGERLWSRLRRRPPRARLGGLVVASLVVSATHPLLDWTNSYGLRPLLPWDSRWFYGDLVFILDPWLWLSLGGACFLLTARTRRRTLAWAGLAAALTAAILLLPARSGMNYPLASRLLWLAGLAGLFVARRARLGERFGPPLAAVALAFVVAYWGALAGLHSLALSRASERASAGLTGDGGRLLRVAAMPTLADPTRWLCVAETEREYARFYVSLADGASPGDLQRFAKPAGGAAEAVARAVARDEAAWVFFDFARFPASRVSRGCAGETLLQLADLRFTVPGQRRGSFTLELPIEENEGTP